jgi:hypothetical protein
MSDESLFKKLCAQSVKRGLNQRTYVRFDGLELMGIHLGEKD